MQHPHGGVGRGAGGRAVRCELHCELAGFGRGEQCERVGHPWIGREHLTDNRVTSAARFVTTTYVPAGIDR